MVQIDKTQDTAGFMVVFSAPATAGKQIALTGSFNDWDDQGIPLKSLPGKTGRIGTTLTLAAGYYEYKFIVNGEWLPDEENPNCAANDFGTLNSVLNVEV